MEKCKWNRQIINYLKIFFLLFFLMLKMAIEHFSLTAFIIIFGFWLTVDQNNEKKSQSKKVLENLTNILFFYSETI